MVYGLYVEPTYVEPFHTLAMIYENQGKMKRSLQFALIAAFLDPKHCQDWPRLAELSLDDNNIPQAIMCYSKGQNLIFIETLRRKYYYNFLIRNYFL